MGARDTRELPRWLWLWLPLLSAALPYVARLVTAESDRFMYGEFGLVENLTLLFLLVGIVAGARLLIRPATGHGLFRAWATLLVLGAVYFAGEEISWGQHFFGWQTPESWAGLNRQAETNLHNVNSLFNQLPRSLLTAAAIVGGIAAPIVKRLRRLDYADGSVASWLWPTYVCMPAAALAVLVSWHQKIYGPLGVAVPEWLGNTAGEIKEAMLGLFIMIYLLSLARRMTQPAASPAARR